MSQWCNQRCDSDWMPRRQDVDNLSKKINEWNSVWIWNTSQCNKIWKKSEIWNLKEIDHILYVKNIDLE